MFKEKQMPINSYAEFNATFVADDDFAESPINDPDNITELLETGSVTIQHENRHFEFVLTCVEVDENGLPL